MDQLKEFGRAIRNSPNAIRKKFDKGRQSKPRVLQPAPLFTMFYPPSSGLRFVSFSSPIELDEDWYHSQDPVVNGVIFYVKVGSL